MEIKPYEEWMRPQVIALFGMEYGVSIEEFDHLFVQFYEHPFQRESCIRIVAVEGERVAGFQSFFSWPVRHQGRLLRSFQSGNSLVHPDFRGKGLFGKMLNFIHEEGSGFTFDLLIGFPVEASYNSFIRNSWKNPFNLQWYVRPMNPVGALISNPEQKMERAFGQRVPLNVSGDMALTNVQWESSFDQYRMGYQTAKYFRCHIEDGGREAWFELKIQTRKKVIRELVIGGAAFSHSDDKWLLQSMNELIRRIRSAASVSMLSIAVNNHSTAWKSVLEKLGFRSIDKQIYFIAKGPVADHITEWESWWFYRRDIDTW